MGEKGPRFAKPVKTTYEQARDFNAGKVDVPKPRQKKADHNKRAKDYWTKYGFTYVRADSYNAFGGVTNDFLGVFDGVQITSYENRGARRKKMLESGLCKKWVECGGRAVILSFKRTATGRYEPFLEELKGEQF
jgi:hypothetical protein